MTLQPHSNSTGRISPLLIRSLGCLGSASLLTSGLIVNSVTLAQEAMDAPLSEGSAPIASIESAPAYEAPLPSPELASPVINLTPQGTLGTQVETVYDEPLADYAPRLESAPANQGGSPIDNSGLYSTGATGSSGGATHVEDADLLTSPALAGGQPGQNGKPVTIANPAAPGVTPGLNKPAQTAGSPAAADAPLTAGAANGAPTNVTAAQAAKIQNAAGPGVNSGVHSSSNGGRNHNLPLPSAAATTQVAGRVSRNNGYSVTHPIGNPLSMAVQSLGRNFAPSLNVRNYLSRTQRPNAVPGNGDRQLLFPLSIPAPISSVFGWRTHPIFGDSRFHSGTDLAAEQGTPIVATLSGLVSTSDFVGGYGLTVVLDHADGRHQTLYAHMAEIYVQPGQIVQQGEVIGLVGSTGNSTGPHLHFEIRELTNDGWVAIDPGRFLEGSIAQLMQLLRNQPMQPISIAQIPIKLGPGQLAQQQRANAPIKLSTGLQPLLQRPTTPAFRPTTPLEQKVVQVVRALEGVPAAQTQAVAPTAPASSAMAPAAAPLINQPVSYQQPVQPRLITQATDLQRNKVQ